MNMVSHIRHLRQYAVHSKKGFTLIELIVVITIVGLFTGIASVSVDQTNSTTRLSNAAYRALSDVRYAQEVAMTKKRAVDVHITPGSNRYWATFTDDGSYLPSPMGSGNLDVTFNQGDYNGVTIASSGLGGLLSFTTTGAPLIGGSGFGSAQSVMFLNSQIHVVVYSSGYTSLEQTVGGGGCGGGC